MNFVNLHIIILSNNIFINILDLNNKVKKIISMGLIGFRHRNKTILEGFEILILNCIEFINEKKLFINNLKLVSILYFRLKVIKKLILHIPINYCRIIEKKNYNGCRLKKKKRQRSKLKIKIYKQF
jgi:hypothetical protein